MQINQEILRSRLQLNKILNRKPLFWLPLLYPKNTFKTIKRTAPGTPSIPTNTAVMQFSPMWNENTVPTKFIRYIINPPNMEFRTSFKILFIGNINIRPNKNKKQIHAI